MSPIDNFRPSMPQCSQCGNYHPPLAQGQRCPGAKVKSKEGDEIDFNALFVPLKNIIISKLEQCKIKDYKKLFGIVIVEITKIIDEYKE